MSPGAASRLAWSCWILTAALLMGSVAIAIPTGSLGTEAALVVVFLAFLLAFVTVGALVASRQPGNAIGWIFCGTGLAWALA